MVGTRLAARLPAHTMYDGEKCLPLGSLTPVGAHNVFDPAMVRAMEVRPRRGLTRRRATNILPSCGSISQLPIRLATFRLPRSPPVETMAISTLTLFLSPASFPLRPGDTPPIGPARGFSLMQPCTSHHHRGRGRPLTCYLGLEASKHTRRLPRLPERVPFIPEKFRRVLVTLWFGARLYTRFVL